MSIIQLGIGDYIPVVSSAVMYAKSSHIYIFGARSYAPGILTEV
jgi:hypothetical protein